MFKNLQNLDERITIDYLINFIKENKNVISQINQIDINTQQKKSIDNENYQLKKLKYQDVKHIKKLSEKLNVFFDVENNKYLHAGVLEFIPNFENINISLFSSIITCLKSGFVSQNILYQQKFISTLLSCLNNGTNKFNYRKYKWESNDLNKSLSKGFIGSNVLKYLNDYFCINIFILDLNKDKLLFSGGETYVPYKKNIFLLYYDNDVFEPLYSESSKFFLFNDKLISNILKNQENVDVYKLCDHLIFEFKETEENLEAIHI